MFRRALPFLRRSIPTLSKVTTFTLAFLFLKHQTEAFQPTKCLHLPSFPHSNIFTEVLPKIIRIEDNGEIVGYAYCFSERLLVTASHELHDRKHWGNKYEYFIGDAKINTNFKIIGSFENLTFIEAEHNVFPVLPGKNAQLYTPIHVVQNRSHLSIRDGYYVDNESGYAVINGKGEVGSLVLNNEGVFGIISHIGRDADYGFLRAIMWKDIKNLVHRLQKTPDKGTIYLGMSVVSNTKDSGIAVVRVAPNSPLAEHIHMGDIVRKVNNSTVQNPDDLTRLIMCSDGKVVFEIETQDKTRKLITVNL